MKKALLTLIYASLALSLFSGCATEEKKEKIVTPASNDRFRTLNTNRANGDTTVACNNCRAQFKISLQAMKSGAVIKCPVCHHHYKM